MESWRYAELFSSERLEQHGLSLAAAQQVTRRRSARRSLHARLKDNESVLLAAYRAIGGENLSPWSKRVTSRVERILRYEGEQTLPGDAIAPDAAGGMLLVGMTPAAGVEAAFNAWYDREHVPALAAVPGVLCARRFHGAATGGGPKYVALYHLTGPEVVDSAAWKQASGSTPMPGQVREQITDRLRLVCRPYKRG